MAGVQSFAVNLENIEVFIEAPNISLAPISSILSKFGIMGRIDPVCNIIAQIGVNQSGEIITSNVNGCIGTIVLFNGPFAGSFIFSFWMAIASFLNQKYKNSRNMSCVLGGLFSAGFALSWFEYYFLHTFWWYFIIFTVLMQLLSKIRIKW